MKPVSWVGMAEGGQHQAPEAGNRDGVNACSRLATQVTHERRVGDRVQRRMRPIETESVRTVGSRFRSRRESSHRSSASSDYSRLGTSPVLRQVQGTERSCFPQVAINLDRSIALHALPAAVAARLRWLLCRT